VGRRSADAEQVAKPVDGQDPLDATTGAHNDQVTSAASAAYGRACPRFVCPCCSTFRWAELTCESQGNSIGPPPDQFSPQALASSSRSQVQTQTASAAARLAWDIPSVDVRWRPLLVMAIVTYFVTQFLRAPEQGRAPDHLIRRLCHPHPLPARITVDLPRCYSLVRTRRQR
jgi:hypothetical protein